MQVESEREVAQLCPTLSNPTDCSLPGSSIHGIFQARVLEWGAIAFSDFFFFLEWVVQMVFYVYIPQLKIRAKAPKSLQKPG